MQIRGCELRVYSAENRAMRQIRIIALLIGFFCSGVFAQPIAWQDWSNDVFQQAKREHKFVLLDLGTQWCHWCHVMDAQTYADVRVQKLIAGKYIALKVDADARPDLGNRYEDYGWPATIVFNADGGEIVKRRGFLPPGEMASMLQAIIDDPSPGPSVVAEAPLVANGETALGSSRQNALRQILIDSYDN